MPKVILILFIVLSFSACSSVKKVEKTDVNRFFDSVIEYKQIKKLNITNGDFIIQKAEIELVTKNESRRFLATIKYKAEGNYLISIRSKTGIEAVRFFVSKDTILINDRINKKFYFGSSEYLLKKYGISSDALPLLFGDLVNNGAKEDLSLLCNEGIVVTDDRVITRNIRYIVNCENKKLSSVRIGLEQSENSFLITYGKFERNNNNIYPKEIVIADSNNDTIIKIAIEKIEFINIEGISFIPGNNYEKVQLK